MNDLNVLSVAAATFGSFTMSGVWYAALSSQLGKISKVYTENSKMASWQVLIELLRSLIVTLFVAVLFSQLSVSEISSSLAYGISLWFAFPVVLLVGSVVHEKVPPQLAAIHAGDWLIKLLFITTVITIWR